MIDSPPVSPIAELAPAPKRIDMLRFAPGSDDVLLRVHGRSTIEVWDLGERGEPLHTVEFETEVKGIRFWPDESGLLVWSDQGAHALDLGSSSVVAQVPKPTAKGGAVSGVLWTIQAIGAGLSAIPVAGGGFWAILPLLASSTSAMAHNFVSADVSGDAGTLWAIAHSHRVYACALHTGERRREWKLAMNERSSLICLPSGRVALGINSKLVILDSHEKKPVFSKTAHLSGVRGLVQMPDGKLATIGENQNMRLWTPSGEKASGLIKLKKQVQEAHAIDDTRLIARATNRRLYLIDTEARPAMTPLLVGDKRKCQAIAVSDDGQRVAIAHADKIVRVYSVESMLAQLAGA